jgi:hypothetical protein
VLSPAGAAAGTVSNVEISSVEHTVSAACGWAWVQQQLLQQQGCCAVVATTCRGCCDDCGVHPCGSRTAGVSHISGSQAQAAQQLYQLRQCLNCKQWYSHTIMSRRGSSQSLAAATGAAVAWVSLSCSRRHCSAWCSVAQRVRLQQQLGLSGYAADLLLGLSGRKWGVCRNLLQPPCSCATLLPAQL